MVEASGGKGRKIIKDAREHEYYSWEANTAHLIELATQRRHCESIHCPSPLDSPNVVEGGPAVGRGEGHRLVVEEPWKAGAPQARDGIPNLSQRIVILVEDRNHRDP